MQHLHELYQTVPITGHIFQQLHVLRSISCNCAVRYLSFYLHI